MTETKLNKCREAFEAWAKLGSEIFNIERAVSGNFYVNESTNNAWFGWQAAYQINEAALKEALGALEKANELSSLGRNIENAYQWGVKPADKEIKVNRIEESITKAITKIKEVLG